MNYTQCGSALALPYADGIAQTCVTSPPYYGLRDYGTAGQIGLEQTPAAYVAQIVAAMREVWRVLRPDATAWINLGDSYGTGTTAARVQGSRGIGANTQSAQDAVGRVGGMAKQLMGIPWRVAFALQDDGWYLRSDIIWAKPNPMPESVTDRPTKAHEYVFLLAKQPRYFYDAEAIKENTDAPPDVRLRSSTFSKAGESGSHHNGNPVVTTIGRNARSVWNIATTPYSASTSISIAASDYVSADGTPYKASASCPIHGPMLASGMFDKASNGGQPIRLTRRNSGTGARHVRVRVSLPTATTSRNETAGASGSEDARIPGSIDARKTSTDRPGHTLPAQTHLRNSHTEEPGELLSDSPDSAARSHSWPATDHSNGTNRTARALPTGQRDTGGGQSLSRTPNTSLFGESAGQGRNNVSSSNGEGETSDYLTVETESHIGGMYSHDELSCTCVKVSIDHFATMPPELARRCILAGSRPGDIVLDPFAGSGTTAMVALQNGRRAIGTELNSKYLRLQDDRTQVTIGLGMVTA